MLYQDRPNSGKSDSLLGVHKKCQKKITSMSHSFLEKYDNKDVTLYPVEQNKSLFETWTSVIAYIYVEDVQNAHYISQYSRMEYIITMRRLLEVTRCRLLNTIQTTAWRQSMAPACIPRYERSIFCASSSPNICK